MYLEFHPLKKKTDHGKFTSLAPQKRTWQRNITIFIIGDTSSKWLVSHCHLDNFPGFFHLSKVPKRPGHQPKNENTTQSTPKTHLFQGVRRPSRVQKSNPKAGCGFDHHLRVLEVPMITQSNIRSAVFRPGGAISFELLVLWFYLVLHLMKEWGRFVGCGMGWGGSMIFLWGG